MTVKLRLFPDDRNVSHLQYNLQSSGTEKLKARKLLNSEFNSEEKESRA